MTSFFSFTGRAKRAKFLQFLPIALVIWLFSAWIDERFIAPNLCLINENWICYLPGEVRDGITLDLIIAALLLIPLFSIIVRRLHDHDRSGWWAIAALPSVCWLGAWLMAVAFAPALYWALTGLAVVTALALLYWLLTKGRKGRNRFG